MSHESTGGAVKASPGLLVIGAGVIVAAWLLGVLTGEWNPGRLDIALCLLVLLSAYKVAGISVGVGVQRIIGYYMGLAIVVFLIGIARFGGWPDGLTVVFYLAWIAGSVLMFLGATKLAD